VKKPVSKFAFQVHNLQRYNVVQYMIGSTPVRGVVDTGSPFITMEAGL
jgi:hypothetical protein